MDDALSLASHQESATQSKLPAFLDTPRSSSGSTSEQVLARPKVNLSPGRTRQVPASNITISSTQRSPDLIGSRTIRLQVQGGQSLAARTWPRRRVRSCPTDPSRG